MPWELAKSRRGVREGDRVMIPWPIEANPDPAAPIPYRMGTARRSAARSDGLAVDMDGGGTIDLPTKGFMKVVKDKDEAGGSPQEGR